MPFGNTFNLDRLPDHTQIRTLFDGWIQNFSKHTGEIRGELLVDEAICKEVVYRYYEDLSRYKAFSKIENQDIFKRMGHWAFWIRKLHPLRLIPEEGHSLSESLSPYVNERFALLISSIHCGFDQCVNVKFSEKFIEDFLFHFRYKSVSPHSLSMLFHALFSKDIERNVIE